MKGGERIIEKISITVGESVDQTVSFTGTWLREDLYFPVPGQSAHAHYGIAETDEGNVALYAIDTPNAGNFVRFYAVEGFGDAKGIFPDELLEAAEEALADDE